MNKVKIITEESEYTLQKRINDFIYNKDIVSINTYFNSYTGERNVIIFYNEEDK